VALEKRKRLSNYFKRRQPTESTAKQRETARNKRQREPTNATPLKRRGVQPTAEQNMVSKHRKITTNGSNKSMGLKTKEEKFQKPCEVSPLHFPQHVLKM
jgi:hypothetical protein